MFPEIGLAFLNNIDNPEFFETEPMDVNQLNDSSYIVSIDGSDYSVTLKEDNSVSINDGLAPKPIAKTETTDNVGSGQIIEAPLGGNIFRAIASRGDVVEADSIVLILEAMKMETEIKAPIAGTITEIFVKPGDTVKPGNPLFAIQS